MVFDQSTICGLVWFEKKRDQTINPIFLKKPDRPDLLNHRPDQMLKLWFGLWFRQSKLRSSLNFTIFLANVITFFSKNKQCNHPN